MPVEVKGLRHVSITIAYTYNAVQKGTPLHIERDLRRALAAVMHLPMPCQRHAMQLIINIEKARAY